MKVTTPADVAARIRGGFLTVTGTGDEAQAVLLTDPADPQSVILEIEREAGPTPVRMHGTADGMREYVLALGWAQLVNTANDTRAWVGHDSLLNEIMGEVAEIHVPAELRRMKVTTTVFGRPVETTVVAASNVGALMMAAHQAAAEALTHPYAAVSEDGKTTRQLPLHPPILDGRRLCVDPVRNADHEPWTWTSHNGEQVDAERTEVIWNDESVDPALRGWYIVLRDSSGEPIEIVGAVSHDARSVLVALYDALPEVQKTTADGAGFHEVATLATRQLQKRLAEAGNEEHDTLGRELLEGIREHQGAGGSESYAAPA